MCLYVIYDYLKLFIITLFFSAPICRRLYDFHLHWLYQTTESWPHQSGRVLRASWGLFCVALFTSYGALLTSNATAPQEYPQISSLEDLLRHPQFKIGIALSSSHFLTALREAEAGTTFADLWQVVYAQNQTDPLTFSANKTHHIRRVLEEEYAFLTSVPIGRLPSYVNADYTYVRFTILWNQLSQMCVPQNAFYKSEMELVLQRATETGVLSFIQMAWFPPEARLNRSRDGRRPKVGLSRFKLMKYAVATGTGLAGWSLIVENLLHFAQYLRPRIM